ncbi:LysM peptidoglycan-binding domain-containing M23 family metallopeptidase [Texcoconibacillus texcoconensis]|uniref:Murein DD-endopeptidase MepM/ murein hydrolase activator NlpD n=1 Tax=Texcoconibacillus texcoconensis TaxID=1095777 RepID=A0A840QU15_9BACI|nr:M23 family metallopeptidase [Texcoconibacillus texcoconensis]MBB5174757.1 murein DD-endopeptidase MepM/ murein hydrolase activator NlpD [Texcoconibacillus texcoconensis]
MKGKIRLSSFSSFIYDRWRKQQQMIKHQWKNYHKRIVTGTLAFAVSLGVSSLSMAQASAHINYFEELEKIYHIEVDDKRIGSVDNYQIVEDKMDKVLKENADQFEGKELLVGENISYTVERVFQSRVDNQQTIGELEDYLEVHVPSEYITVDGETVGHIDADKDVKEIRKSLIKDYLSDDEWEQWQERAGEALDEEEVIEDIQSGEEVLIDIELSADIESEQSSAHPDQILSIDEAKDVIINGTLEEDKYEVSEGDVLGSIASDHDLSLNELLALNDDIDEDTLLQLGDELSVTVYEPLIDVVVERIKKEEQTIRYQERTEEDDAIWQGESEVRQSGSDGEKLITSANVYENGQSVAEEIIEEEVTKEAKDRIVVHGTKTSPSRGTGDLVRPTVGGTMTSPMGPRWGRMHNGIDVAGVSNRDILAADNGVVSSAGNEGGYGNTVRINHNNGMETVYAHLSSIDVSVGQTVGQGQTIGTMGSTGRSTGVHLHFEVHENGQVKDPLNYVTY